MKAVTFEGLGQYAFYDVRFDQEGNKKDHPFNDARYKGASILIVGSNFGCGSSREHAPQALMRFGIKAIIGESFAEIFAGNSLAIGLPLVTAPPDQIQRLMDLVEEEPRTEVQLDLEQQSLRVGDTTIPISMNETSRSALIEGHWDSTAVLAANLPKVREVAARLPYISGFQRSVPH
jgi:3-isopropylmalate/(R)-2-methylmalate dehydratase small subunit